MVQQPFRLFPKLPSMKTLFKIIFLCTITLTSTHSFSQGKLDQSKTEVKKGNKKESHQSNSTSTSTSASTAASNYNDDKSLGEIIAEGIFKGFLYLTYYSIAGDYKTEKHLHSRVTKYPYYNRHSGNYESTDSGAPKKKHFRADLDYQFLYSGNSLTGNHFKCNIRPFQYFYLQAQYHQLTERNSNGTHSNLSLYNFNFCYDRLRFEKFNLGWKLGMCYIANEVKAGGFSAGADAEAFLIKPFSVYIAKQWGAINNVAVNEFELAGKFYTKRYSFHLGYEHLKIGSPLYDYVFIGAGVHL